MWLGQLKYISLINYPFLFFKLWEGPIDDILKPDGSMRGAQVHRMY